MFRAAIWLGVILLFVSCDAAPAAAAPKEKFTAPCPACAKTVDFTPSKIVIKGSATLTNGVQTFRTLHFKCPACRKKTSVPNTAFKKAAAPAVPYRPLPPALPGRTNKVTGKVVKLTTAAAPKAMFTPASVVIPPNTNWIYRANVTPNHDGFAFWTPADTIFEADSAWTLPASWTPFAGWGPQTNAEYNGVLVPAARGSGYPPYPAFYLRPRFTPSSAPLTFRSMRASPSRKEVQWALPNGRKVRVYLHNN